MKLNHLRREIDRIDIRLLALLNRRAAVARKIGEVKRRQGLAIFDGKRESAVLSRMIRSNGGPLSPSAVRAIFQVILRHNRRLQGKR
ncbi:MAG: chorismate mutase [Candidatus Omnitrophica bacterium]|nr:chorismate mutase [Candidatus Omnitrophota bacterium]